MHLRVGENSIHLQLRGKQSAHFGHVIFFTADSVIHLFISVFAFARTVRRPRHVDHSSGQGWRPGLICNAGVYKKGTQTLTLKSQALQHLVMFLLTSKMTL